MLFDITLIIIVFGSGIFGVFYTLRRRAQSNQIAMKTEGLQDNDVVRIFEEIENKVKEFNFEVTKPNKAMEIDELGTGKEQSHFEDIDVRELCIHPEHNPPMNLHIPQGKRYIHICPSCGKRVVIQPQQIR